MASSYIILLMNTIISVTFAYNVKNNIIFLDNIFLSFMKKFSFLLVKTAVLVQTIIKMLIS